MDHTWLCGPSGQQCTRAVTQPGRQLSQIRPLLRASCSGDRDGQTAGSRNRAGGTGRTPRCPGRRAAVAGVWSRAEHAPRPLEGQLTLSLAAVSPRPVCSPGGGGSSSGRATWAPGAEGGICSGLPSGAGGRRPAEVRPPLGGDGAGPGTSRVTGVTRGVWTPPLLTQLKPRLKRMASAQLPHAVSSTSPRPGSAVTRV